MIIKIINILKKFSILFWYGFRNKPFEVLFQTYTHYCSGGRKEATKFINNSYKILIRHTLNNNEIYQRWIKKNEKSICDVELLSYNPLVTIITSLKDVNKGYLEEMILSVIQQTYVDWEWIIVYEDSISQNLIDIVEKYERKYKRICLMKQDNDSSVSEYNTALLASSGQYIIILHCADILSLNALYEMVKKLNENRSLELVYSDEDRLDKKGNRYSPHFKSGWNRDMLFSQNYIGNLYLLKSENVKKIGGFKKKYMSSMEYDLLLRYIKEIKDSNIDRIEKILYHARISESLLVDSTLQKSVLEDYFSTCKIDVFVEMGLEPSTFKINYSLPEKVPLVSIIIPTKNQFDILKQCINSILNKTNYKNYEIIIVDNQSSDERILNYFFTLNKSQNIRVISYPYPFNYSTINNYAVLYAKGEYVLFLNNDVEIINYNWIEEMLQHAQRPDIGVVGAKLYYDDDTIQHAGIILGLGGIAGHSHKHFHRQDRGYYSRLKITQNYSAVTGACMLVSKEIFNDVNGFDEDLAVAFNDVDFSLKVKEKGYRNLWTPYTELYHYESKTRGIDNTQIKQNRFKKEVSFMKNKWSHVLKYDDFYNKNLTHDNEDFGLSV
ncbi:MAG TPA: glycosyltransferase [Arcobacter sp.]|nr:glycosyltransferase [Arcobacter sp.]